MPMPKAMFAVSEGRGKKSSCEAGLEGEKDPLVSVKFDKSIFCSVYLSRCFLFPDK